MGSLFSTPKTAATQSTRAMGIQLQGSQYGPPIPVLYGRNKVAGNCLWYGDFKSHKHEQKVGGKGGGATSTSYTYSCSFQMGICEGQVGALRTIYKGTKIVSATQIGAVFANGAVGQAAWSHLSSPFDLGYSHTALISVQNLSLGSSPSLPNYNYEIDGLVQFNNGTATSPDCDPKDILTDICTSVDHGIGFSLLGNLTQYSNYCVANSLFLSPVYKQQQAANQTLADLFKWTNSMAYFSENQLKVVPLGDQAVTGNGVTYTPNNTPVVALTADDLLVSSPNDPPVEIDRSAPADAENLIRIEFQDRSQNYHTSGVVASIDEDINTNGQRSSQSIQIDAITQGSVARFVVQNMLQRKFFIRNTYRFRLGWRYCYLEPTDIVTLPAAYVGTTADAPVRILSVEEDEHGTLTITAEEFPEGIGHSASYTYETPTGELIDTGVDPGAVNSPFIFRGPGFLVNGNNPEIWCAVNGSGQYWAGCGVYLSLDGVTYEWLGNYVGGARYGFIATGSSLPVASDPDTTSTPNMQLNSPGELVSVSQAEADNFNTLSIVDSEVIAYENATLKAANEYQLGYIRRGGYGSAIAAHAAGAPFARLDDSIIRIPVDPSLIGTVVYLKFLSFNDFGDTPRTLADETAYTYTVGDNVELPDVPAVPGSPTATSVADGVSLKWTNTNPAAVGATSIEYATSSGGPWSGLAVVGGGTDHYVHKFTTGATYYYRLQSRGYLPQSGWSAYTATISNAGKTVANGADVTSANQSASTASLSNHTQDDLVAGSTFGRARLGYVDSSGRVYNLWDSVGGAIRSPNYLYVGSSRAQTGLDSSGVIVSGLHPVDNLKDGTFARPRASALQNGVPLGTGTGDNTVVNPSFELNKMGSPVDGAFVTSGPVVDGWEVGELSNAGCFAGARLSASAATTGAHSVACSLNPTAFSIPAGNAQFMGVWSADPIDCTPGDKYVVSGDMDRYFSVAPPAGISINMNVLMRFYDGTGAFLSQTGPTFTGINRASPTPSKTVTVPANAAAYRAYCLVIVQNTSGAAINIDQTNGQFFWDNIKVSRVLSLDTHVQDGTTRFAAVEPNANNTETRTSANTSAVGSQSATNVADGTVRARTGLDSSGVLVSGLHPVDNLKDGTTYARIKGSELTSGQHKLGIAGSGYKVGDVRNVDLANTFGLGMQFSAAPISLDSSGNMSLNAFTATSGNRSAPYSAITNAITGLPTYTYNSTLGVNQYYIYAFYLLDDMAGGTPTVHYIQIGQAASGAATQPNATQMQSIQSPFLVYLGGAQIPASGTTSGGSNPKLSTP